MNRAVAINEERRAVAAHIEEGYQQARAQARLEIQATKENWRRERSSKR